MKTLELLRKLTFLLLVGVVLSAMQSCSSDDDKDLPNTKINNVSILKSWYLTAEYAGSSTNPINWTGDSIVIGRKESMEFSIPTDTLMLTWKNRLNKADARYYVSGFDGNTEIGDYFYVSKVPNRTESTLKICGISERNLLILDYSKYLYKVFVASDYAVFLETDDDNGDDGSDSGDDSGDDSDSDNDNNDDPNADNDGDGYIKVECPRCHGSGECRGQHCDNGTCTRCGGSGYRYDKGVGGTTIKTSCLYCTRGKCETCRGSNKCPACNGKGYIYGQK